jgi:hypothetical protein
MMAVPNPGAGRGGGLQPRGDPLKWMDATRRCPKPGGEPG